MGREFRSVGRKGESKFVCLENKQGVVSPFSYLLLDIMKVVSLWMCPFDK